MHNLLFTLLMAPPPGSKQNPIMSFLPIILIIVVFYFFMIRPQLKKAKEQKKFHESIKKGDKIVTIGGIYGKITDITENGFIIEVESGTKLRIMKTAVSLENTQALGTEKKA